MRGDFGRRDQDDSEQDEDSDRDTDEDDPSQDGQGDDDEDGEPPASGGEILAAADSDALDAFRDLLAAVLSSLDQEEEDLLRVAQRADVETLNPDEMAPDELARLTYELAGSYPDVLEALTNRFPHAERLLTAVLGGENASRVDPEEYEAE